jgi:4'-phosphopantetheinyl transferase
MAVGDTDQRPPGQGHPIPLATARSVEVWMVRPAPVADDVLDIAERARAAQLHRPQDRQGYVAAHVALRALAGARLGCSPAAVRFERAPCPLCGGPHGRPVLADGDIEISLSRTGGMVAIALSPVVVGVDVERVDRPVGLDDLVVALHPAELPMASRAAALRLWVRKEAYLKGRGTGLGVDPATVEVTGDPPGWRITDIDAGPELVAAAAVRSDEAVSMTVTPVDVRDLA